MTRSRKTKKMTAKTRAAQSVAARDARETGGAPSATAVAAEALATGVVPMQAQSRGASRIPGQDELLRIGDRDDRPIENAYLGDETPGRDMPTPDRNQVDAYGRAMGVSEEDSGALRTSSELLDRRDRHRGNQEVPEDHSKD